MRIDSPGIKAWLIGKFSGSFKGHLYGVAESASHASLAITASHALESDLATTASYAVQATNADTASYALYAETSSLAFDALNAETASYVGVEGVDGLDERIEDFTSNYLPLTGGVVTGSLTVLDRLVAEGKVQAKNIVSVEKDLEVTGSVKFHNILKNRGAEIRYVGETDVLEFRFTSRTYSEDTGSAPDPDPDPPAPTGSSHHVPGMDDTDITIPNTTG